LFDLLPQILTSRDRLLMTAASLLQYALFLAIVTVLVRPAGLYMQRVFERQHTWLDPVLCPVERAIYRVSGVNPDAEMDWRTYSIAFVVFTLVGTLVLLVILLMQWALPFYDPTYITTPMTPDLAVNVAVSFTTTTTWQPYAGESTMTYTAQMFGLAAQSFLAGAAGLAIGMAFIRGLAGRRVLSLGNFWVDVVRATLWVLLPIAFVGGLILVWQGVPINWQPYVQATTVEGATQTIAQGPVATLQLIENLGTNGGGFFNANAAHPYENPTPLTNLFEMLAIAVLPAGLTYTFGRMVGRPREGWMLYWVMVCLFVAAIGATGWAEQTGNPLIPATTSVLPGGNMEGKETRFGIGASVLTEIVTANTATGSVNSAPDSYTPIGGMVALVCMLLGEIIFGGLGSGLYSLILIVLVALFITGLMVGRTPEYVGKKIGPPEMKLVMIFTLLGPAALLVLAAIASVTDAGTSALTTNTGAHGFTAIVFAYASSLANNGQAFAGMNANSPFWNVTTVVAMLVGRVGLGVAALALAGRFGLQPIRRVSLGTLQTDSVLFGGVVIGTAIVVVALNYFPALALGPIIEHLKMIAQA
jgi:potassium-transporting ATPase potassium-binding subunit